MINRLWVKSRSCLYGLLYVLCCIHAVPALSQPRVTLKAKNESLDKVTTLITLQTGYNFAFPNDWTKKANRVTLSIVNGTIDSALKICFRNQPFHYNIEDKTVVINWKPAILYAATPNHPQTMTVRVWVTDTGGTAISRVSIKFKRSGKEVYTNDGGQLVLENVDKRDSLLFTATNYEPTVVGVTSPMLVRMILKVDKLGAVEVSSGYDPQHSIGANTGNISVINAKDLLRQPVSDFSAGLTGRVPGLFAVQSSGVPGAQVGIQLRGRNSLLTGNDMLVVVDGVPLMHAQQSAGKLKSAATQLDNGTGLSPLMGIDAADIDSIAVLKDAAATALYGIQGGNGVLSITMKKGKKGKPSWQAGLQTGWSKAVQRVDWMNTEEYFQLREDAFRLDGKTITPTTAPDLFWNRKAYTNFPKLLTGKTARHMLARVAVSGGSDHTYYRLSGSHFRQDQVFLGEFKDNRSTIMLNGWHKASNQLTVSLTLLYGHNRNQPPRVDLSIYNNLPPHLQLQDNEGKPNWIQNGEYIYHIPGLTNPLSYRDKYYSFSSKHLLGSMQLNYHLRKNLLFRLRTGFNLFHTDERFASPQKSLPPGTAVPRTAEFGKGSNNNWIVEPQLIYKHAMKNAQLTLLGSISFLQSKAAERVINASGYQDDASLHSPDLAATKMINTDTSRYRNAAFSLNADYVLKERYKINVSVRADGSNRFGGSTHYTPLGAIGAAWIFSKTTWMKEQLPFISMGKIRASWGLVGNDQVGDGKQIGYWYPDVAYGEYAASQSGNFFEPSYTWERNQRMELALEAGFFKNRLTILAVRYQNRSSNLLIEKPGPDNAPASRIIGNSGAIVENKGIELMITAQAALSRRVSWTCQFNVTFPKNRLITFPDIDSASYGKQYEVGRPLSSYSAYTSLGVNPATGLFDVVTRSANGIPSLQDMQLSGHLEPEYYGGIQNVFFTKRWEFSFFIDFRKQTMKNYMINATTHQPGLPMNQPKDVLDRWRREGDKTSWFRPSTITGGEVFAAAHNMAYSTDAYTNTFFARIKNVELAYMLPIERSRLKAIESCRLYVQAQHLFTFTNYKGDPETQDIGVLPLLRTFALGVDITL